MRSVYLSFTKIISVFTFLMILSTGASADWVCFKNESGKDLIIKNKGGGMSYFYKGGSGCESNGGTVYEILNMADGKLLCTVRTVAAHHKERPRDYSNAIILQSHPTQYCKP